MRLFLNVPGFLRGVLTKALVSSIRKQVKGQAVGQGIGRHTREEVEIMGMNDLKTISDYLGEKTFMMGDQPTEIDCVIFGLVQDL